MISFWGYELLPQRKVVSRILEGIPKKISAAVSKCTAPQKLDTKLLGCFL